MISVKRSALMLAATALFLLLVAPIKSSPVMAKETWMKVRSKNFTLVGNASEKEIRQVATRLEQFRDVFSRLFTRARLSTHTPTTVVVFKSAGAYKPYNPRGVAGYFQPGQDVNYITLTAERDGESPYATIFHEYVHLMVENNLPPHTPAWLNEGLAEYYSTFDITDGDKKVILGKPISNHVLFLREQKFLPLPTLLAVDHDSAHYNERTKRGVFYAQSWALMHYLQFGKEGQRRTQLTRYIELLNRGASAEDGFRQVFEADVTTIEKELKSYIGRNSYSGQIITFDKRLEFDGEMESAPITEAETASYLGDLLLHSHQLEAAESHLQKAIALDPALAMAHASLGMLRVRQNRFDDAKQSLERAVSASTQNYLAHYYYAYALMRQQMDQSSLVRSFSPQTAGALRTHLRKVMELAPQFAEAYDMLAFVNLITGENLDESVALVKRAMALAPGRANYALTLAQVQMSLQDFAAARQTLNSLVKSAVAEPQLRANAQSILDSLDAMEKFEAERKAAIAVDNNRSAVAVMAESDDDNRNTPQQEVTPETPTASTLRPPKAGEAQAHGLLVRIECAASKGVVLHVKNGDQLLRLHKDDIGRIEFVTFTPDISGELSCGARNPPNTVFVTYRPLKDKRTKADGEVVAVDFIPKDWK